MIPTIPAAADAVRGAQVKVWRRGYDVRPPALEPSDARFPGRDRRYNDLTDQELPRAECLKDTVARFLPCWHAAIAPAVRAGQRVIIAAHGNSLRALIMQLDQLTREQVLELNIPTGVPLCYELSTDGKVLSRKYL